MFKILSYIIIFSVFLFHVYGLNNTNQDEYKEDNYIDTLTSQGQNFLGLKDLKNKEKSPSRLTVPKDYKNLKLACQSLEGKFVVAIQDFYFVEKCTLRPLDSHYLTHKIVMAKSHRYETVGNKTLAFFPLGKNFSYGDYLEFRKDPKSKVIKKICKKYEHAVVTQDGNQFFYIKNCTKYPFASYMDVENFKKDKILTYRSLTAQHLNMLPLGEEIRINKDDDSSPYEKRIDFVSYKNACKKLNNTLVAYHAKVFLLKNCSISQVLNFPILDQLRYAQKHSVISIDTRDFLELKLDSPISADKLREYLK